MVPRPYPDLKAVSSSSGRPSPWRCGTLHANVILAGATLFIGQQHLAAMVIRAVRLGTTPIIVPSPAEGSPFLCSRHVLAFFALPPVVVHSETLLLIALPDSGLKPHQLLVLSATAVCSIPQLWRGIAHPGV